jgi:hypothetical protein
MLGLRDQVRGHPLRPRGPVRHDDNLGRPRQHVYADPTNHLPLGLRDPPVPRTHDLVHPWNRPGAVGERGDSLRPAHSEYPGDPRQRAGGQDQVGNPLGWNDRDDLLDPGYQGRNRVHHHRGRVRGLPSGHVKTHPVQGSHFHSHQAAVRLGQVVPAIALALMVFSDPLDRAGKRFPKRRAYPA